MFIALNEGEANPPFRSLYEPSIAHLLDGAPEPWCPLWKVGRVRGVLVNFFRRVVNPFVDMPGFRSHGAIISDASDIVIVRNGYAQDRCQRLRTAL